MHEDTKSQADSKSGDRHNTQRFSALRVTSSPLVVTFFFERVFVVPYNMQKKRVKHFLARHTSVHLFFRVQLTLYRITFDVATQKRQKKCELSLFGTNVQYFTDH